MKFKQLLAVALLLFSVGVWAQTDVTNMYITNAGFETDAAASNLSSAQTSPSGWTLTSSSGTSNTQWGTANASTTIQGYATSFSPSAGTNYFYLRCNWQNGTTLSLAQTTSELPAGTYAISFDAVTYSSNGTQPTYTFTISNGSSTLVNGSMINSNTKWVNNTYVFTLESASSLTITASMKPGAAAGGKHDWMLIDNFKLIALNSNVTSTYVTNAGFETDDAASSLSNVQTSPTGWTLTSSNNTDNTQWGTANSSTTIQGLATSESPSEGNNYFYLRCNWQKNVALSVTNTTESLLEGKYTLVFDAFTYSNQGTQPAYTTTVGGETINMANNSKAWRTYSVNFTVTTPGTTDIVAVMTPKSDGGGKHDWMLLDNFRLFYVAPSNEDYDNALEAANAAYNDDTYANITGNEKAALKAAIDADPTGQYVAATEALISATETFIAAKNSYDAYVTAKAAAVGVNEADVLAVIIANNVEATAEDALAASVILPKAYAIKTATASEPIVTDFVINGTFDNSDISMWSCNTSFQNRGRKTTDDNGAGNMNPNKPWWENWNGSALVNKMSQAISNIPNGTYRLDITAFVNNVKAESQYVFANSDQTSLTDGATSGATYEVYTVVTNNQIEVGLEQTTATANWMGIDNVSLRYFGHGDVINDAKNAASKQAWLAAVAAAQTAISENPNVTGEELTALNQELDKAEPTTMEGYNSATESINSAKAVLVAAATNYNKFAIEKASALAIGVTETNANAVTMTSASGLDDAMHQLYVLEDAAATSEYTVDGTDIFGTWSTQNADNAHGEHWSGDASRTYFDKWNSSGFSMGVTNNVTLPAGKYVFKIAGRAAVNSINGAFNMSVKIGNNNPIYKDFVAKGNSGKGIDTSGAVNYGDGSFARDDAGQGWEWRFIGFELETETAVELKAYSQILGGNWVGFSDPTLLTTNDNIAIAKSVWEKAKTAAETARDNTDYDKVDGAERQTLTDAINATETETADWYQNQTEVLKTATADFTDEATVTAYNRWDAAQTEATSINFTHNYAIGNTTTATEALTYANGLYTDMLGAQMTEKAQGTKVLGFQAGEYAPYTNAEVIAALSAANAITDVTATETAALDAAINALSAAPTWTANVSDVDAIFNGTFAEKGTGNNPKGWARSNNGWGQQITGLSTDNNGVAEGTTTAWYYNNNGAWQYGNESVYTMPLVANQTYMLAFKYRKNGNDWQTWMKASVINANNEGLNVIQFPGAEDGTTFKSVKAYFTTGAAGNYILNIEQNGNAHLTDVSLVKAETATFTLNEDNTDHLELAYFETVNLTRTLSSSYWNTFCSPVSITAEEITASFGVGTKVREMDTNANVENNVIRFKDADAIEAGKPYLVKPTQDVVNPTFTEKIVVAEGQTITNGDYKYIGSLAKTTLAAPETDATALDLYLSIDGTMKKPGENGATIKGMRAYFNVPVAAVQAGVKLFIAGEDITTSIDEIDGQNIVNAPVYNLAGQRVGKAQKGIYIVNGKKVLVK